jgi:hypothetical protein
MVLAINQGDKDNPEYFIYGNIKENKKFFNMLKSYVGIEERLV